MSTSQNSTNTCDCVDYTVQEYWDGIIKMSLSKFFILRVLYDRESYGYDIARSVAEMTHGCCTPTEGTIYPVLREFEKCGCLEARSELVNGRVRKIYTLTPKGRYAFEIAAKTWLEATRYVVQAAELTDVPKA